ncbi:MAG: endonuclease/exonuclease/phosphatase family protein [Spirochaetia bacterium]|nr:endonuclease/exonuclease/phosphatase family protein [Spirochaetia bacterium]
MNPFRPTFTVCSYNIWSTFRWPERREALRAFARIHRPDILCLQELQSDSRLVLDETLAETHARVNDSFEGWAREGNIYWNKDLFEAKEFGVVDIGMIETLRRLFWVRLALRDGSGRSLLVSTAHYTWPGHPDLVASGKNARIPQAHATLEALARLRKSDEPQLFMGDLNDSELIVRILREGGLVDCFEALGRSSRATWPAMPTEKGAPTTLDWMFHVGSLKVRSAEVVDFFIGELAPSDHKPVLASYQF